MPTKRPSQCHDGRRADNNRGTLACSEGGDIPAPPVSISALRKPMYLNWWKIPEGWEWVVERRACTACDGGLRQCNGNCNGMVSGGYRPRRTPLWFWETGTYQ